jgi:hypothetical protein
LPNQHWVEGLPGGLKFFLKNSPKYIFYEVGNFLVAIYDVWIGNCPYLKLKVSEQEVIDFL